MNRRSFVRNFSAATLLPSAASGAGGQAEVSPVRLVVEGTKPGAPIPADFVGLSYESAQLANPAFFSAANQPLVELFRALSPTGNLRLGGGSSEFTTFSEASPGSPPPFEVFGPDTSHTVKSGTVTSALAIRNLRGFLDATGWSCLYGLNLGQGTKENAVAEAKAAHAILGPRLLALQIGNEPDSFRNRYRPASWLPADFMREWNGFHEAIRAAVPQAKFAGPDISNKLAYLTAFAAEAPQHPDVILLTLHYYAMGPARSPDATLEQLFVPDPKLATIHEHSLAEIAAAVETAHLPLRISEGNSCWDGGKPGVSDTLASALWCFATMCRFAGRGWAGFNLHGGGNGFYTPIAGAPSTGFSRRPEYFGMQFFARLRGATSLPCTLGPNPPEALQAFAFALAGQHRIALVNAAAQPVSVELPAAATGHADLLTGPSLESKDGTTIQTVPIPRRTTVNVPAHAALLLTVAR